MSISSPNRDLPPVTVDGFAFCEFSVRLNRALKRFERRFGARQVAPNPVLRQQWEQPARKPR